MNKHIVNVLNKYSFEFEKNTAYGTINGYEVNVINLPMANGPIFYFSTNLTLEKKALFVQKMKNYKISLLTANYFEFGVSVMIGAFTSKSFEKKFDDTMGKILNTLDLLEAPKKEFCPSSGIELSLDNSTLASINTNAGLPIKVRLTNEAINDVNNLITQVNEEFKNAPNNYLKGYMGIFLGAVVGVIATIVLASLGFVSAISPLISIFLGVFLYKKFGGKPNWIMIVMSFVTTIVFILGYILYVYVVYSNGICSEQNIALAGIDALKYCLNADEELAKSFRSDLIFNLLFCLVAVAASAFSLAKSIKRPQNINH